MAEEFFKWSDTYSVGHKIIDEQHKVLIGILNKIYNAYLEKRHESEIKDTLKKLTEYTIYHFATEEKLFVENNYVETAAHIAQHSSFIKGLEPFNAMIETNPTLASIKVITFVQKWLLDHIMKSDKKYMVMF